MFPEWTEIELRDIEAIQHLRLNGLRDRINEVLFPYVTLITPYLRVISWLVWIFTRLEKERKTSKNQMRLPEYEEKAERYYKIFATAEIAHAKFSRLEHLGPVGVDLISRAWANLTTEHVDFTEFLSEKRLNPIDNYSSSIENMNLLTPKLLSISPRRNEHVYIPTDKGKKLSSLFENRWREIITSDALTRKTLFTKNELYKLGEAICLQGLSAKDPESKLLLEAISASVDKLQFKDFVDTVILIAKKCHELNASFKAQDIGRAALYRTLEIGQKFQRLILPETEATALTAYHELHTHTSYGADAVLSGISQAAKNNVGGISLERLVEESTESLRNDPVWKPDRLVNGCVKELIEQFSTLPSKFQHKIPVANGYYGFETIQKRISQSKQKAYDLIALGAIALLQSACGEECFNHTWLSKLLAEHGKAFSARTFLEILQALSPDATLKDWIRCSVERIIEQHENVVNDKGDYAAKIVRKNDIIYCVDEPTAYSMNRGRLDNAIAWLADAGLLKRKGSEYQIAEGI